jgi:hypothetical protein
VKNPGLKGMPMNPIERGVLGDVLARVDRLERENRRLKLAGAAALGLVVLAAAGGRQDGGEPSYDVVRARRFVVVDVKGVERGLLGMSDETPRIALGPDLGSTQFQIDAGQDQTIFDMSLPEGEPTVRLLANANGGTIQADVLRGRLETPADRGRDRD